MRLSTRSGRRKQGDNRSVCVLLLWRLQFLLGLTMDAPNRGIIITPLPGATYTKPGSATLPFFGIGTHLFLTVQASPFTS